MKKRFFGIGIVLAVFGLCVAGCSLSANDSLVGKWYIDATRVVAAYEFTSDGKLLILEVDTGFTFTTSGNQITVSLLDVPTGTATYAISGNTLTLSNVGLSGLKAGTYYR